MFSFIVEPALKFSVRAALDTTMSRSCGWATVVTQVDLPPKKESVQLSVNNEGLVRLSVEGDIAAKFYLCT